MKFSSMQSSFFSLLGFSILFNSCILNSSKLNDKPLSENANNLEISTNQNYWFDGKAEISTFSLVQARYGEIRQAEAVLIFVTEDFSKSKQVKMDNPSSDLKDKQTVLKLNMTKRFNTGIYPYHMILSVFTPYNETSDYFPIKTTASVSEWCGQVFTQLNRKSDHYLSQSFSYFESEADQEKKLPILWIEDGIWNVLRLNPEALPIGEIKMIPGVFFSRLKHQSQDPQTAICSLQKNDIGVNIYTIKYPNAGRILEIQFTNSYPYPIIGWKESYKDGNSELSTSATLKHRTKLDYWNLNSNKDSIYRKELQLQF
ncbi:MAG: hypothetical protein IPH93_16710 [Saprospiraceae bacterium]|nr:hypothetical protein [Saprospiraceae bacterium]MBK7811328.1 hypothetical protein [Saprospiraceae bacterium]